MIPASKMNAGFSLLNNCIRGNLLGSRSISSSGSLLMRLTQPLAAEPLKKKKRADPNITKQKEDKKKRKIEKQIRRLEKNEGQLKPIEENEVSLKLRNELKLRERALTPLTEEEIDRRRDLEVKFARHRQAQWDKDQLVFEKAIAAQKRALEELKRVSEDLWFEAIQDDKFLLPFRSEGPCVSLPLPHYNPPDGDYNDISRKWD